MISSLALPMTNPQESTKANESTQPAEREALPSFDLLVQQHQAKLYNFIYRYTKNREDTQDLVQDTFVKAFRFFHRYDSRYAFSTWLYTIARRTVYNHYRRTKYTETIDFEIADEGTRPDDEAERSDTSESVWSLVKGLKADYREALALKYVDDLSVKEIAQIMDKSQTNVKILLFRGRNQLKKLRSIALLSQ